MKILSTIIIGLNMIIGCNSSGDNLKTGKYISKEFTKLEFLYYKQIKGINGFITGSELNINSDSTFTLLTCGNFITGKWNIKSDSVFLNIHQNTLRRDSSIVYQRPITQSETNPRVSKFKIDGNYLVGIILHYDGTKALNKFEYNSK